MCRTDSLRLTDSAIASNDKLPSAVLLTSVRMFAFAYDNTSKVTVKQIRPDSSFSHVDFWIEISEDDITWFTRLSAYHASL